ncbi:hypothetical protein AVEN_235120-1, partial [Araneus ventricosus]
RTSVENIKFDGSSHNVLTVRLIELVDDGICTPNRDVLVNNAWWSAETVLELKTLATERNDGFSTIGCTQSFNKSREIAESTYGIV